jgi:hypothetical protein
MLKCQGLVYVDILRTFSDPNPWIGEPMNFTGPVATSVSMDREFGFSRPT